MHTSRPELESNVCKPYSHVLLIVPDLSQDEHLYLKVSNRQLTYFSMTYKPFLCRAMMTLTWQYNTKIGVAKAIAALHALLSSAIWKCVNAMYSLSVTPDAGSCKWMKMYLRLICKEVVWLPQGTM